MAVSHGHSSFVTNLCPPREASNSSSNKYSSLNDNSCSNIASHSSSSEMCLHQHAQATRGPLHIPGQHTKLTFLTTYTVVLGTTGQSIFEFLPTRQRHPALRAFLRMPYPDVGTLGSFAQVLICHRAQNPAALVTQQIGLRIHTHFLQERICPERVRQGSSPTRRKLNRDLEFMTTNTDHVRFHTSNQGLLNCTARIPAPSIFQPKRDLTVCSKKGHGPSRCSANSEANKKAIRLPPFCTQCDQSFATPEIQKEPNHEPTPFSDTILPGPGSLLSQQRTRFQRTVHQTVVPVQRHSS